MHFTKQTPFHVVVACAIVFGMTILPCVAAETAEPKEKSGGGNGKFVSFKDGTLTLLDKDGVLIVNKISEDIKTFQAIDGGGTKPVDTVATLKELKAGTWVLVNSFKGKPVASILVGTGKYIGSFVSFKDDRLLIQGKNFDPNRIKTYGNAIHFVKFRDDVPVYESVDGGEYKLIGMANKVLKDVKEGTVITVHFEMEHLITLVQIGMPKKQ